MSGVGVSEWRNIEEVVEILGGKPLPVALLAALENPSHDRRRSGRPAVSSGCTLPRCGRGEDERKASGKAKATVLEAQVGRSDRLKRSW